MRCSLLGLMGILMMATSLTGCVTQDNTLEKTVYDTHRRVSTLDKSLQSSVDKLSQNSDDLSKKTDATEQNVKNLQETVEHNSKKLSELERKLEALTQALNRSLNATPAPPAPSGSPSEVNPTQKVQIEGPGNNR